MIVYADPNHYQPENRYHLNDIIKALWNDRTPEERDQVYGKWVRNYTFTTNIADADVVLLSMKWDYYVNNGITNQAFEEISNASNQGKKTLVFCSWDFAANLTHPQVILVESGGYRSASGLYYHSGQPFFLRDYVDLYCEGELRLRPWSPTPVIGFCGQASAAPLRTFFRTIRNRYQNWRYQRGKLKWQPPPFETTSFRYQVLQQFTGNDRVSTNFLLREQYHAGDGKDRSDHSPQKLTFVNNILNSDYTVCMRGGGNFSIRFYETLSLGRIPIFIDTDCLLPFEDMIPYRDLFPWIEVNDLPRAAEIVADFHARLGTGGFEERQADCRKLWEEHFTTNNFHGDLHRKIHEII